MFDVFSGPDAWMAFLAVGIMGAGGALMIFVREKIMNWFKANGYSKEKSNGDNGQV